jgi:hypothetical protein
MERPGEEVSGAVSAKYPKYTQRMHNTPSAQWVDSAEVVAVSTDAQHSSSQQGINLFLKGNVKTEKKSPVVAVVAVDFCSLRWVVATADEFGRF